MRWENDRDRDGFIAACDGTISQTNLQQGLWQKMQRPSVGEGHKGGGFLT